MNDDQVSFLKLEILPARVNAVEAGWLLGFPTHHIPPLTSSGLLRALGRPSHNSVRYFSTAEIIKLSKDRDWLAKATDAVANFWKEKNRSRRATASSHALSNANGRIQSY